MFPSCRAAGRPGGRVRGGSLLSYYCSLSICTQSVLRSVHLPACLSACLSGRGRRLTVAECGAGVGIAAMAAEVNEGGGGGHGVATVTVAVRMGAVGT